MYIAMNRFRVTYAKDSGHYLPMRCLNYVNHTIRPREPAIQNGLRS
jgi:hypothetical protein